MKPNFSRIFVLAFAGWTALSLLPAHAKDKPLLGKPQAAGPFQITLSTIPVAPQAGVNRFRVEIHRKGEIVSDAQVSLTLTMPLHRHGGRSGNEPEVTPRLVFANGAYLGTARLSMQGVWQAQIFVRSAADKGKVTYRFTAGKAAPVHLGMAHMAGDFEVTLTTEPPVPQAGDNRFVVSVSRDGQAVQDATVSVDFSRPANQPPAFSVTLARNNHLYDGTATLPEPGDWEARINVQSGDTKGTALYQFRVGK